MIYWKFILNQILISITLVSLVIITHELTHYTIFSSFECENIRFGFSWGSFYTIGSKIGCIYPGFMLLAHAINDIVCYCVIPFLVLLSYKRIEEDIIKTELLDD